MKSQNSVYVHFTSKEILPFGFADQSCCLLDQLLCSNSYTLALHNVYFVTKMLIYIYPIYRPTIIVQRNSHITFKRWPPLDGCATLRQKRLPNNSSQECSVFHQIATVIKIVVKYKLKPGFLTDCQDI